MSLAYLQCTSIELHALLREHKRAQYSLTYLFINLIEWNFSVQRQLKLIFLILMSKYTKH